MKRFGDIDEEYSNLKRSKINIVSAPYGKTVTYRKGCENGPEAIIEASTNMELFDDELFQETFTLGIYPMEPLSFEGLESEGVVGKIKDSVLGVLKNNKFPVLLGGEHTVSIGAVMAAKEAFEDVVVLHFDAHYDLRNEYGGTTWNHACVGRRILEICPLVQVGVRSLSIEERDFVNSLGPESKLYTITPYDILEIYDWKERILNALNGPVYITIDLDVFDPSLMPSVGTPEPGGLGWYETLELLKMICRNRRVIGFDITELLPMKGMEQSDFFAAKLIYRLLGYVFPLNKNKN